MTDIDSILDSTLDDLDDLPSYENYPIGAYRVLVSMKLIDINSRTVVELSFTLEEVLELEDAEAKAPKRGDASSILFFLDTKYGEGNFKRLGTPLAEHLGTSSGRELIEQTENIECVIITGIQKDKKKPGVEYMLIKELSVV